MPEQPTIAIVGASGAVGREALSILSERAFPASRLALYGSPRSAGSVIPYLGSTLRIRPMQEIAHNSPAFALLCADARTAVDIRLLLPGSDTVIIDNSSAFRMEPVVPLVIPEVNGHLLDAKPSLIANPNCSTIMLLTALNPIRETHGVRAVTVTTYQAVSGAGAAGIEELQTQTKAFLTNTECPPTVFPVSCAFNVFEHESPIDPATGFNGEESKMIAESRRIWDEPTLPVLPTCVRVPVERAHAQAVIVDLTAPATMEDLRSILADTPGVRLHAGPSPLTPRNTTGTDEVRIGRIRIAPDDPRRALIWLCCDQIRKGAALNAIQIMDRLTAGTPSPLTPRPAGV